MDRPRWAPGAGALLVLAAVSLLPSIFSPFVADDYFHMDAASRLSDALVKGWILPIDSSGAWWTPRGLSVDYFRPLVVLSFALDRLLYGTQAPGYHLTNLVLHGGATLLTWAIATQVLGRGFAAWTAAALFAIHPCHVQAVCWVSGRTDVLASLLYMAALLLYLHGRGRSRAESAALTAASLCAFFLALLAKEMAVTFPAVVLVDGLLRRRDDPLPRRVLMPALATAVAGLYFALRFAALGRFRTPPSPFAFHLGDSGLIRHSLVAPLAYLGDFTLFVPADPMVTVPFWNAHSVLFALFVGVAAYAFSGTLRRASGRTVAAWGVAWMAITLLPVAMLTVGEHFLYLPSVGYCILVGSQLPRSAANLDTRGRRTVPLIGAIVVAVCLVRTVLLERVAYASSHTIEEAAVALDRCPHATSLLVVDLPAGASLAFPHAIRFERPGRAANVEILSILPVLNPASADLSVANFRSPDRLEVRRDAGFFLSSYIERALAGPKKSFMPGETFDRPGHQVTVLEAPDGRLQAFETKLSDPAHTLVLRENRHGLTVLSPSPDVCSSLPIDP